MTRLVNVFVSVVYVVDEHSEKMADKVNEFSELLRANYANYEIVLIENGLRRSELRSIRKLLADVACVRVVQLSKRHDTDTAVFAGIENAIGDYICILYGHDPVELIPQFVARARKKDIVFGVARNLRRKNMAQDMGARIFYWYSKKYMDIKVPTGSTYYMCMNRSAANALTKSNRFMRHVRHMAVQIGFQTANFHYELPESQRIYARGKTAPLTHAVDLVSNYSSHPLRALTYFGLGAGLLNIIYAGYVLTVKVTEDQVMRGWTTLSLQSSLMFFLLFIILAVLAEYVGKILIESQSEPPYHVMRELSSTVPIADETRRNVVMED